LTPQEILLSNRKTHYVAVHREGYLPYFKLVRRFQIDTVAIECALTPDRAWLRMLPLTDSTSASLDGSLLPSPDSSFMAVQPGIHAMRFAGPGTARWIDRGIILNAGDSATVLGSVGTRSFFPLAYSTLIPGAGQLYDRAPLEGIGFLAGFGGSLAYMLHARASHDDARENYLTILNLYRSQTTEAGAAAYRPAVEQRIDELNAASRRVNIATAVTIGVYVLNLVDAFFHHGYDDSVDLALGRRRIQLVPRISPGFYNVRAGIELRY
jgi:hypothetical protein